jgi:hypothetical protein
MSIENYFIEGQDSTGLGGARNAILGLTMDLGSLDDAYVSWAAAGGVESVAREYFAKNTSGSGEAGEISERLEALGIEGGLDGLDFSETSLGSEDITVKVSYRVKLMFPLYSIDGVDMSQTAVSRLWKFQEWKFAGKAG